MTRPDEEATLLPTSTDNKVDRNMKYYLIWIWRLCIFAITGSSSVHVTRFLLRSILHTDNMWYYYTAFFFLEMIVYTVMIVSIGTLLLQWRFFCLVAYKMWSWALPSSFKQWCQKHLYNEDRYL